MPSNASPASRFQLVTFPAVVKLAKEIDESASDVVGCNVFMQPASRRRLVTGRGKIRWSRRHRGVCLGVDAVGFGMVSLIMSSRDKHDKLRRAMLSSSRLRGLVTW